MELARGRRAPFTQIGDWVALSTVSRNAKLLYVMLAMHVSQLRSDGSVWPSRAALAALLGYSKPDSIDPFVKELVTLQAIEVRPRRKPNGSPDTNLYVVHETPPPVYQGFSTLADFYASRTPGRGVPPSSGGGVAPNSGGGVPPSSGYELYEVELDEVEPEELRTTCKIAADSSAAEIVKASGELAPAVQNFRPEVEALCQKLAERMIENGCKPPTIDKGWRDSARLLLDKDDRDLEKTLRLIDWCQQDGFWRKNILSMAKFRKQYDALRLAALEEWEKARRAPNGHPGDLVEANGITLTRRNAEQFEIVRKMKEAEAAAGIIPSTDLTGEYAWLAEASAPRRELEAATR